MKIGELSEIITLQRLTETNSQGVLTQAWTKITNVWGKVVTERGSEAFESARLNAKQVIRVGIRYRDDIDITGRLLWLGQQYSVIAVDRSHRRKGMLWLTAQVEGAT